MTTFSDRLRRAAQVLRAHQITIILALLLLSSAAVRLYKLPASLAEWHVLPTTGYFKGFFEGIYPLLSPQTLGNLGHYGPALLYFLMPFGLFSHSPLVVILALALLSTCSVYLLYRFGKDFFSRDVGLFAAIIYSFSWFALVADRRGLNADFTPVFGILMFYLICHVMRGKRRSIPIILFCAAMLLQLHFTAFVAVPVAFILLGVMFFRDTNKRKWVLPLIVGFLVFSLMFLPYALYESRNGFAETGARVQFLASLLGGDRGDSPATGGIFDTISLNLRKICTSNHYSNPLALDLAEDYICETGGGVAPPFWSIFVKHLHTFFTMLEMLFIPVSLLFLIVQCIIRRKSLKGEDIVVLGWVASGILPLLVRQWDGPSHPAFVFPVVNLIVAIALVRILGKMGKWKNAARIFAFTGVCIFAFASAVLFLAATNQVERESCVQESFADLPLGALIDIQQGLISDLGVNPPIYFFRSRWGPVPDPYPVSLPPRRASISDNLTFAFFRDEDLLGCCLLPDYETNISAGRLIAFHSPRLNRVRHSAHAEGEWQSPWFNDSGWSEALPDFSSWGLGKITVCIGEGLNPSCDVGFEQGDYFLRFYVYSDSTRESALILTRTPGDYVLEEIHINGVPVSPRVKTPVGVLLEGPVHLLEGENVIAFRLAAPPDYYALGEQIHDIGIMLVPVGGCEW